MKFPYSSIFAAAPDAGDFLLLRRPEIPVTIVGPGGSANYLGLVDTGSDNTIFPASVADYLRIRVDVAEDQSAGVFGGHRVRLLSGEATFKLEAEGETVTWRATICFFRFPSPDEECVILGHSGFLDYFTATFDGKLGLLTLVPNDELPIRA